MNDSTTHSCAWLHAQLYKLPLVSYPFDINILPSNGIYFFYQYGETWGHGDFSQRIVRVGTHRQGNFHSRIGEHFVLNERKMNFDSSRPRPHDRSIFRKHLGAAILNREGNDYLRLWSKNLLKSEARAAVLGERNIGLETAIENEVTELLRGSFSFRFIRLEEERLRMGAEGLERALVGTLARCSQCRPSEEWLGLSSPNRHITEKGLWQLHYLKAAGLSEDQRSVLSAAMT